MVLKEVQVLPLALYAVVHRAINTRLVFEFAATGIPNVQMQLLGFA
jgi:hypothetical protein